MENVIITRLYVDNLLKAVALCAVFAANFLSPAIANSSSAAVWRSETACVGQEISAGDNSGEILTLCKVTDAKDEKPGKRSKPAIKVPEVSLLSASPGEDSSTQVRLSWHSANPSCKVALKTSDSGTFTWVPCRSEKTPVAYTGNENYYRYTAELDGLKPGSEYTYKVVSGEFNSQEQTFRTAGTDGTFNFLWIGDIHSTPNRPGKMKSVDRLLAAAKAATGKSGIAFILCTGDAVKNGQTYACWNEWNGSKTMAEYIFAAISGNKEYYQDEGKLRWHDKWFTNARNNPPNGATGLAGTYFFRYNGVLFVGLDSLACEGREMDDNVRQNAQRLQEEWLEKAVTLMKGKFRYLVVFQHYPYFKKSGPCDYGCYARWNRIFDRLGVDFALSGDSHSYVRSRQIRGEQDSDAGTVYVVCPEIDSQLSKPTLGKGDGLVAMRDKNGSSYGACWFSVTPKAMTMHYICDGTSDYDMVKVKAKRR